jgi:hypothetical protein
VKLRANEMLFINCSEAALEKARRAITNDGSTATVAKHLRAAADFLHQAADLLTARVKEAR